MFFSFIRKVPLLVCLVILLLVSIPSNSTNAQGFEDDPLFGDDEIGFGETSGDFQDSNYGVSGDIQDPAMEGEADPFAPVDEEEDLYIDEESFDIDTEQAFFLWRGLREGCSSSRYGEIDRLIRVNFENFLNGRFDQSQL